MLMYYSECMVRLKVHWKLDFPPSWTQWVLKRFVMSYVSVVLLKLVSRPLPVSERPRLWREEHQDLLLILTSLVGNSCFLFVKRDNNHHHRMEY